MRQIACDLCIIGAGPGGLTVASAAAQLGRKVVLVERGKMGGDCLNHGCVPSKALIAAARHAHGFRSAGKFGIAAAEPLVDFAKVMAHVHDVMASIEPDDSQERFEKLGCTVIRETGRFSDDSTLEAGDHSIKARRFVIATGSSPHVPSIGGLKSVPYFTSDTIFDNTILPEHLIVIGAGAMGLELAQAFRRLGSRVTVLEALSPLAGHDPELAAIVLKALAGEKIEIIFPCKVGSVRKGAHGIALSIEEGATPRELAASHLLLASGRRPNVEHLNLESAGIKFSDRGIEVDARLKTSNPRVYAVGDVLGGLQFTHVAAHQAGLVVRNALFRQPVRYNRDHMPWAVYTDPEFSGAGVMEDEAIGHRLSPKVLRWPLSRGDRARIERRADGLYKVILDRRNNVIGAAIVAPHAGELILPWTRMIANRRKIASMAESVIPYPAFSDDSRRVALTNYAALSANPWVRRFIDVVSSFP
jgi:pyruvate/2-oxoglutarate dehydrogenase complex dihydrolipoamide dehydrogenase (E3) component